MSGLLGDVLPALYSGADVIKRRVKGLLGDPRQFLAERSQDLQTMQDQDSALAYQRGLLSPQDPAMARMARNEPAFNAQQAAEAEQRLLDIAMQGLTVWHGSPHKFDKFDSSKIGTGEGAQAYGHGLYFAENPEVAKSYQFAGQSNQWFDTSLAKYGNRSIDSLYESAMKKKDMLDRARVDVHNPAYKQAIAEATFWEYLMSHQHPDVAISNALADASGWPELAAFVKKIDKKKFSGLPEVTGGIYKVDLPDSAIEKMLDWDKPLSQQPESVRKAIMSTAVYQDRLAGHKAGRLRHPDEATGNQWLSFLQDEASLRAAGTGRPLESAGLHRFPASDGSNPNTSAEMFLNQAGIPGIRYLDGGSRGAGQGTRNFVVFPGNEGLLNILERNGQGLLGTP